MTRGQAFIFLVVLPTITMLVIDSISFFDDFHFIGQTVFRIPISYWYYRVLRTIKTQSEISRAQESLILLFIIAQGTFPILEFSIDKFFPNHNISIPVIAFLTIAAIGLTILILQFQKILEKRNIKLDGLTSLIYMAAYPIGIYQYWNLTKVSR